MTWRASVLTLFPEMFPGPLAHSLAGRALQSGIWSLQAVNIRDFATDRHRTVDDTPFGGGAGMVLRPDVVDAAIASVADDRPLVFLTPRGRTLTQRDVQRYAAAPGVILLCGRYEGVDQRVIDARDMEEVSIGDYVLSGGELAGAGPARCHGAPAARRDGRRRQRGGRSPSRDTCWNTRTTRARPNGRDGACPTSCCPVITPRIAAWRQAEAERITRERRPDLWERTRQPLAPRRLPARRPRLKDISTEGPER